MKVMFDPKRKLDIGDVNRRAQDGRALVDESERQYEERVRNAAKEVLNSGCRVVLLSGPSGSGKTTSSLKLAKCIEGYGVDTEVISLDNFFKNIENYPETPDGKKDFESVYALDIDAINDRLHDLVHKGRAEIPEFDFVRQCRKDESCSVELGKDGVAIIEGIHALNPILSDSINHSEAFRIYAGLREEYYEGDVRVIATRDLRITRRMIRDFYFRGHSIRNTLELWGRLLDGEETWIKIFKPEADMLLDTSFTYEACVFRPLLDKIFADETQGGDYRDDLAAIVGRFSAMAPVEEALVPENSMLREFLGGLKL